ncbi:MAG: isoleucine--tRNA ligase [Clostridiales bacterium]|jgi:isoleucyl-tRNA synthetase|nr:isoleucine--tRNA ligase [Clostridiales bacterium]
MYEKVTTDLNFVKREGEVMDFWKRCNIVKKSLNHRRGGERFTFYDGPPTANGKPHIGHVITRAVKDIIPRYRSMKGYDVLRKAGWDTHGLPVELEVERQLGINGKPQIEEYGVAPFIEKCKESVWTYKSQWQDMSDRVAYWADMENAYVTYTNEYIESVWWSLKRIWEKDLIYKGHRIVPYCPRCGTALSSHEVAQGYKDVVEKAVFVKFRVAGRQNEFFLAWTTTPWTLPSNTALVVHPDYEYVKVEWRGAFYILAKELVGAVFGGETVNAAEEYTGAQLVGTSYEPLFDFVSPAEKAWYVCADRYVTLTEGSGIVHTAPAFGEDDARVGRDNGLPFVQLVDAQGLFVESVRPWKGMFVKDADPLIIADLESRGLLFRAEDHAHSYPFCWRCDTPLLYYARDTWFIRMTALRENLLRNNERINWLPDNIKRGRFGNFLENVVDWNLSRERYWGTPLPIWECAGDAGGAGGCGHRHMVGSIAELRELGQDVPADIELHKPYIDAVLIRCPKCGGQMRRVPEVIDCWYDSGAMPFAQWHYPFENEEAFRRSYPANFISEAVDQTRGWFYTLLAISTLVFDDASFQNCIVLGHVLDKDGVKMSKHKGNVIDPWDALDRQGADAVRWYFFSNSAPWLPSRFYMEAVDEGQRKFMGTLWNTYAFYILYAEIDRFDPTEHTLDRGRLDVMDRWILSRLHTLIRLVDRELSEYRITEPTRAIQVFVDELSNWYVRRCRERFWRKGMEPDKVAAYLTLYTVLSELVRLVAPFVPFISEMIHQNLVRSVDHTAPESVHLCDFPVSDESQIDPALERGMQVALDAVTLGRACRNAANLKNRQPLSKIYVVSQTPPDEPFARIITDELNIKEIAFVEGTGEFVTHRMKPQLKTLGPRYGKLLPKIGAYLADADGDAAMRELDATGLLKFTIDGQEVALTVEDLLIETARREHYVTDSDGRMTVALDIRVTDELLEEGNVRELVSKIQNMRKEAGFEVQDHILLGLGKSELFSGVLARNYEQIARETLTDGLLGPETFGGPVGAGAPAAGGEQGPEAAGPGLYQKEWKLNAETVALAVKKA